MPFEIVAETTFAHHGLLASKLGKKESTNLGAIQIAIGILSGCVSVIVAKDRCLRVFLDDPKIP